MRAFTVILCLVGTVLAGVGINHAYIAGRSAAASPVRAFDLYSSALTFGAAAVICIACALALYVLTTRQQQVRESSG